MFASPRLLAHSLRWLLFVLLTGTYAGVSSQVIEREYLLMLDPGSDPRDIEQACSNGDLRSWQIRFTRTLSSRMNIHLFTAHADGIPESETLHALCALPGVRIGQQNHAVQLRSAAPMPPEDPLFSEQWNLHNVLDSTQGKTDADIDALEAWELSTGGLSSLGDSIVVAVVDEGFDLRHPAINWWKNRAEIPGNGLDDDQNGYVDDHEGWNALSRSGTLPVREHGTHVAGVIGARANDGSGTVGINWGVQIMPLVGIGNEATVIEAYGYIYEARMRFNESGGKEGAFVVVTNASFGADQNRPEDFPLWCAVFDSLGQAGILNVAAATNRNVDVDSFGDIPTLCESEFLLAVTNTDRYDEKFPGGYSARSVDLGAPGVDIWSTFPGNSYGTLTGTSESSPHVAGVIALMYARACQGWMAAYLNAPSTYARQIRTLLLQATDPLESLAELTVSGGRLNAFSSLQAIDQLCQDTLLSTCIPPHRLISTPRGDTAMWVSWQGDSLGLHPVLYRPVGTALWDTSTVFDRRETLLTGLAGCQAYEVQVLYDCDGTLLASPVSQTQTLGCCEAPAPILLAAGDSSLTLSWEAVFGASSYRLRFRQSGQTWDSLEVGATTYSWTSLQPCTQYEVQLATQCQDSTGTWGEILALRTAGCGFCEETAYCEARGLPVTLDPEWIDTVQIGTFVQASGDNQGYGDFRFPPFSLNPGSTYPLKLVPGFTDTAFPEYWRIWLDVDQDGIFQDSELIFDPGSSSSEAIEDQLQIPLETLPGTTRLRIAMRFISAPEACGIFDSGEVEDYCVYIAEEILVCPTPVWEIRYDSLGVPLIAWEQVGRIPRTLFQWRENAGVPWNSLPLDSLTRLSGLPPCSAVQGRMAALCEGDTSDFSPITTFYTGRCESCTTLPYCLPGSALEPTLSIAQLELDQQLFVPEMGSTYGLAAAEIFTLPKDLFFPAVLTRSGTATQDRGYWRIWVDGDQDGTFSEAELILQHPRPAAAVFPLNLSLPPEFLTGLTRMRISLQVRPDPFPCDTLGDAQFLDLCVRLLPAVKGRPALRQMTLQLFPNPTKGQTQVNFSGNRAQVLLFNALGEKIEPAWTQTGAGTGTLDLQHLSPGLYLLRVSSDQGMGWARLIKH